MKVTFTKILTKWMWEVYDSQGLLFCVSAKTYSRRSDAVRAFQRLDVLF